LFFEVPGIAQLFGLAVSKPPPQRDIPVLKQYSFGFYEIGRRLEKLRHDADTWALYPKYGIEAKKLPESSQKEVLKAIGEMRDECLALDLTNATDLLSFIESQILDKKGEYTYNDLLKDLDTFSFSFGNELRKHFFFRLADNKKDFFQQHNLFGQRVNDAFPSCTAEVQNAGSCFAVEQYDACVFNLMRVLERGLGALALRFGVSIEHTNWQNVIEQIEATIRKMDSSFGKDWKEQQKFYSQAASQFMFFKDAWRNHVMHARDVYDEGKALSVLTHVREFMEALTQGGLTENTR